MPVQKLPEALSDGRRRSSHVSVGLDNGISVRTPIQMFFSEHLSPGGPSSDTEVTAMHTLLVGYAFEAIAFLIAFA